MKFDRIQCVSLIDHKKDEEKLGSTYTKCHQSCSKDENDLYKDKVNYVWFDYHRECRGMKVENLEKLIESIRERITGYGYFEANFKKNNFIKTPNDNFNITKMKYTIEPLKHQVGVIRNNCLDCLDRTNVVQSVLGRLVLLQIFQSLKLMDFKSPLTRFNNESFESIFRNIWTDNADQMSILYAGTPALKTDFTRTGKRSVLGAINDGNNSLKRYVFNNFMDYER